MADTTIPACVCCADGTVLAIILAVSFSHFLNDVMQSLISLLYLMLKTDYQLDFWQIGMLTATLQVAASLLKQVIGHISLTRSTLLKMMSNRRTRSRRTRTGLGRRLQP